MSEYIEEDPSILALDAAGKAVRAHIAKCGSIQEMGERDFATLKDLNVEVERLFNKAFIVNTVGIKS